MALKRAALESAAKAALRSVLPLHLAAPTQVHQAHDGSLHVNLRLATAAAPVRRLKEETERALRPIAPTPDVTVTTAVAHPSSFMGVKAPSSLASVGALLGVSSCKGGVGKSTVALNLAVALAELGGRVGLLDADVHGPSLPSLVSLPEGSLPVVQSTSTKLLRPPSAHGVKLMSYGYIAKGASAGLAPAAVMRGTAVGKVVQQMLAGCEWGTLDYLVVDLPPGTGDVHLTLSQTYGLTGAVVVSTPQRLATADVLKGIEMLQLMNTPIMALVENMSHFTDDTGRVHHPFGSSQMEAVRERARLPADAAFRLPIEPGMCAASDRGVPYVGRGCDAAELRSEDDDPTAVTIRGLATYLVDRLAERQRADVAAGRDGMLRFEPTRGIVLRVLAGADEGGEFVLPRDAFAALPGAPATGADRPVEVTACVTSEGEAAARVVWGDGAAAELTYRELKRRATELA